VKEKRRASNEERQMREE